MSASSDGLTLRDAGPGDSAFIADMAVEAMNWNPERAPLSRDEILSTPALRHYFAGWPRPDDIGLIATDERQRPIGAA